MMSINRRKFIRYGSAGFAGIAASNAVFNSLGCSFLNKEELPVDIVSLGKTGLIVPRIAMGTGTAGFRYKSNQSDLGKENFIQLVRHCFDKGIRFIDTADMYGTHDFVGAALQELPRDKMTILTKVMVYDQREWYKTEPFEKSLDRFRKSLKTDYIDILLLHAIMIENWADEYRFYMDALSEAKQKGIIKAVGVSCHNAGALKLASEHPWVEVIMAQINNKGPRMDGPPEVIMPILENAHKNGKGLIAMKVFGCGQLVKEEEREASLNYVIQSSNLDCMTLGVENTAQVDDNIERVMRIVKSNKQNRI